jgi:hypothetical protein
MRIALNVHYRGGRLAVYCKRRLTNKSTLNWLSAQRGQNLCKARSLSGC